MVKADTGLLAKCDPILSPSLHLSFHVTVGWRQRLHEFEEALPNATSFQEG